VLKNVINSGFREFVDENISLNKEDRGFLVEIYSAFSDCFDKQTIQIGSVPRKTAIKPLHDLDILILSGSVLGDNRGFSIEPKIAMKNIQKKFEDNFSNPTEYIIKTRIQSHSIGVYFYDGTDVVFSVDLVPSYTLSKKNNYGDDIYKVPEIVRVSRSKRNAYYDDLNKSQRMLPWIDSDPRGYISDGVRLNDINEDFRTSVKLLKAWKGVCKDVNEKFKLKSFHIEQILYQYFCEDNELEVYEVIFRFLTDIESHLHSPQIKDRADSSRYIDQYITELTDAEKGTILSFADKALISLEWIDRHGDFQFFIKSCEKFKRSDDEEFLFDKRITVHSDPSDCFEIDGYVRTKGGGCAGYYLSKRNSKVNKGRKIDFKIIRPPLMSTSNNILWKVKNSDCSPQPRGEISDGKTRNYPENTEYIGNHYVEAYVVDDGVCVARSVCPVEIIGV